MLMKGNFSKPINIISMSDQHLGHPKTKTKNIINAIKKTLFNSKELKEADILILGGDWTHSLLSFSGETPGEIFRFMTSLLRWCVQHDIVVRVLKGTPSHDWDQNEWFIRANEEGNVGCDIKYFNTVCIERMDRFGIDVLYVPDEWRNGPEDAWEDVDRCMIELGIECVDVAVVHGTFEHHLPEHVKTHKHSCSAYESITRYIVLIGHIHTHSICGKLATNGSFDRTAHGEEEPKGLQYVTLLPKGGTKIRFVENKYATTFKTIFVIDTDIGKALDHIDKEMAGLVDGNIRLRVPEDSEINNCYSEIRAKYSNFSWTKEKAIDAKAKEKIQSNIKMGFDRDKSVTVTRDNILPLLQNELLDLDDDLKNLVINKLKEVTTYVSSR